MSVSGVSSNSDGSLRSYLIDKDANDQVAEAQRRVKSAQQEAEVQIEHLKDSYERQTGAEISRNEANLENLKHKGYEQLRDLQRGQQKQMRMDRAQGEHEIQRLHDHYKEALLLEEHKGNEKLHELEVQNYHAIENEDKRSTEELEDLKMKNTAQNQLLRQSTADQLELMTKEAKHELADKQEEIKNLNARALEHLETTLNSTVADHDATLQKIFRNTTNQIRQVRRDTSYKLGAYGSRQSDPFYKMLTMEGKLTEHSDYFEFQARIPHHEQKTIHASIKGDNLLITGYRTNEESLSDGKGHTVGSASYQSFHESFPLAWPVDARQLSKQFIGDQMIIKVPKRNEFAFREPQIRKPERIRAEPPNFPPNLEVDPAALIPPEDRPKDGDDKAGPVAKRSGSGTLS